MADPKRVAELFDAALDVPPANVDAFLRGACGDDAELAQKVRDLLKADAGAAESFLEAGAGAEEFAAHARELVPGATFAGCYEILHELGRGGMGVVYRVLDRRTESDRALTGMRPDVVAEPTLRRRFAREATVSGRLESEHVVDVIDAGIDEASGEPFILMELLAGRDLAHVMRDEGAQPVEMVRRFLQQLSYALDKAHVLGLVHRDLKPGNLFVTQRDDGTPHLKVLDFGLAKIINESTLHTRLTAGMVGTPLYMAPEQVHTDAPIGPRTDLFAVGHVTYALLVGEAYWAPEAERSKSAFSLVRKMIRGLPEAAGQRARGRARVALPAALDAWFARSTAIDPAERFASASEQLERFRDATS